MQRLSLILVLGGMVMLGLYFMANKPVPVAVTPQTPRPQTPSVNPVVSQPQTPLPPATQFRPAGAAPSPVNPNLGRYQYLSSGKVKLDMNLLSRGAGFAIANPKITLEDMVRGRAGPDRVVIPAQFNLTYELLAGCSAYPVILSVPRVFKRWQRNMNIFIEHSQERAETVAQLGMRLQNEKCVKQVTVNNAVPPTVINNAPPDAGQVRIVTEAVQKLVARRKTPHFIFVGSREAIILADPSLADPDEETRKPHDSPGFYTLNGRNVPVIRRAVMSREHRGGTTSSRISMALAKAATLEADIIIVDQDGFDRKDNESAIAYATSKGAVIVTNVPVPPPDPAFAREAAKRREERNIKGDGGGDGGGDDDQGGGNRARRGGGGGGGGGARGGGRRGGGGGAGGGGNRGAGKSGGASKN